jgi:phosphoglucosamine mutase
MKLFGTDGMRGEAGRFPLDSKTVEIVGASLANHLGKQLGRTPTIVIGRDTRESGEWLEYALVTGARDQGATLKSAGVITTPGVAFLARTLPADAGIVISASHNPFKDNGIKIFARSGRKLDEATERLIEKDVASGEFSAVFTALSLSSDNLIAEAAELRNRYIDFLCDEIGRGLFLKDRRIVIDCANGAGSAIAPELFERLGATVIALNAEPNGRNINLGCGSLYMTGLQDEVLKHNADIGVALDGDADRALFVDARGRLVNGDGYLWVLAKYLQAKHQLQGDIVVATVMSNIGLEIALGSRQIRLLRTDVGDKYVLDELLRVGASLGGEQSGHIIFPHLSLAGDGIITTLCLLRVMQEERKGLAELTDGFQTFPQTLVNVEVREKLPFDDVPAIKQATQEVQQSLGPQGRLLLRYSGTESLARVMLEGKSQEEIDEHANHLAGVIRHAIGR